MLVQALARYADTYLADDLQDEAWEEKPVPYLIEIGEDGSFLSVVPRMVSVQRGKKMISVPQRLRVPRSPVNRVSGLHPLLAADGIKYVLGAGAWTKPNEHQNHTERFEAFVVLANKAAQQTGDPALEACTRFYGRQAEVEKARSAMAEAKPGSLVALSVRGPLVERETVQQYWREHYRAAYQQRVETGGGVGECLISGKVGPIAPTHEKIKGTTSLGGQAAGVSLMSFDKEAFRSYGWDQNQNSPVSPDRAMAYVLALNDLLRTDKGRRRDIAGVGFIFWLKKPGPFDPFPILNQADESQVKAMLSLDSGANPDPEGPENPEGRNLFYLAGLSGNGGRLRVRYWVTDSLQHVKCNLRQWFEGLRVGGFGDATGPVPFWQLLRAIDRDGEPPADRVIALLRRAIEGRAQPLGDRILGAALRPLRHSGDATPARLGLVRLCINDIIHVRQEGERPMQENLDVEQRNPAYLCGRLLALFESLQVAAFRGESQPNVNVTDRYYSLASANPAVAFPRIDDLGKKHLQKLRRKSWGAASAIEQRIQELCGVLGFKFPGVLDLDQQGRFALGYYHQKAESIAQAKARKEQNAREEEEN